MVAIMCEGRVAHRVWDHATLPCYVATRTSLRGKSTAGCAAAET
jgi:hypothetical protein